MAVYSALIDTRGTPRIYASSCNPFFGMKVLRSTDLGKKFKETKSAPGVSEGRRPRARQHLVARSRATARRSCWCGVEPASLFRSDDGGDSWEMVPGISNHEHARKWHPGNGGLCMHTILRDGNRVHLGISTGGHYLSEDGGADLQAPRTTASAPASRPIPIPSSASACTRSRAHTDAPGRLYMQNHGGWAEWDGPGGRRPDIGVLRSDDHGKTWRSIAKGLPSDFGFPIVVHPHDPDTVYVAAARAGDAHLPRRRRRPCGAARTAATRGSKLAKGLPKKESFFTVLRDAMDIDELKSPALYFGTTTGQLWMGRDGGEEWECLFDSLPPIHCVKVAVA